MAVPQGSKCWEWSGHVHNSGYGRITWRRKTYYAHRFYWERINGEIPHGMDVCHECDNKLCVNPDHLFLGTRQANMDDARIKGRLQKGEDRHNSVLTEPIVRKARSLRKQGMKVKDIAEMFGIQRQTMGCAISRKTWRHVV